MNRILTDIYNRFESIWNTLPEEKKQDKGSLQLTREQQTAVIEAIRHYVKPELGISLGKTIFANISTNSHITRLALSAIQNKEEFKDLKQELSSTVLENLQNTLLISKTSEKENDVLENWLETYKDHFDAQTIGSMDTDTLFHLVEILAKFQNQDDLHSIIQSLPENARTYLNILKNADSNTPDVRLFETHFNENEVPIALAHFISYKKCEIGKLGCSKELLLQIAPYLRYGDFRDLDENLIHELLVYSQKINHLLINNKEIKSIKADLLNCQLLNCSGCEALQKLPKLPNCQVLHCSGCETLQKLPKLPKCLVLNCSGCKTLQKLTKLPNCQVLTCNDCEALQELPKLPECLVLTCSDCEALQKVSELPKCDALDCSGCKTLRKLPNLPECRALYSEGCEALDELPELPECLELYLNGCEALRKLSNLSKCHTLDCSGCRKLEELPDLPECQTLTCSGCDELRKLSNLPKCHTLDCSGCKKLEELPELPECHKLNCSGCGMLKELPDLPECQTLICSECDELQQLRDLTKCQALDCSKCGKLRELPDLPDCDTLNCSDCKVLQKLSNLPKCQMLDCGGCEALRKLSELPNCGTLYCDGCQALRKLSNLPKCHTLDCSGCRKLKELPDLPECQTLTCSKCDELQQLRDLTKCQTLDCSKCGKLKELGDLTKCQTLDCSRCGMLKELPNLPECHTLDCSGCDELQQLRDLTKCQVLDCSKCGKLKKLSNLANCQNLFCNKCEALQKLPELPKCRMLDCNECGALEELPELPECHTLNCSNCGMLEELPDLPNCQTLDCSKCGKLEILPQGLPVCYYFYCQECPNLAQFPEVPAYCNIFTEGNQQLNFNRMEVDVEKLSSDPKSLLLELGRSFLLNKKPFPNIAYYSQGKLSEAVDVGGVRRDFVTRLLREIFKSENPIHLNIQENGWPEKMCDQETVVERELDQETIDCYRTLGKLFVLCHHSHSRYKPGNIFPESVYHAIAMAKDPNHFSDEEWISCYLLLKGVSLEVLRVIQENDISTVEDKTIDFASYLLDPDWDDNFQGIDPREFLSKPENKEKLKATLLENAMREPSLNAISWIAKEMKKSLGNNRWNNFRTDQRRMEKIQGVVSQEEVIKALNWVKGEVVGEKQHEETMTFMDNWIRSADYEQLRSFIFAVTGNNAISEKIKIQLETYNRGPDRLPSAHTCSLSLELSAEYPDQQAFDQVMKTFLKYACHGFDSA